MNKKLILLAVPFLSLSLISCGGGENPTPADETDPEYYSKISERVAYEEDSDLSFDDEITNGLDDKVWETLDGYWENGGTTPHNGVRRRNLFYTKDDKGNGYLAMKARGRYNEDEELQGKPEGACIETINNLGPGRYEVYMAAMPRDGGVSALWTYNCPTGSEELSQYEIDIEIGGGAQFENLWCTSWTTKTNKATYAPSVTNTCYMNDGKIHKYTFDWYTDYLSSGEGRVDWFIDGNYLTSIKGGTVTDTAMPVWLGIWLPSWAGNSLFTEDYLLIDRVSYKAFATDSQTYTETRSHTTYSPKKPSESKIQTIEMSKITGLNKLSNGDCEKFAEFKKDDYYGWQKYTGYNGTLEQSDECVEGNHSFKLTALSDNKKDAAYVYQEIECAYQGFKFDLSFDAKAEDEDTKAFVWVWESTYGGATQIRQTKINLDSTEFKSYGCQIEMAEKSGNLRIFMAVTKGSALFDNFYLIKK